MAQTSGGFNLPEDRIWRVFMYQTGYVPPVGICSYKIRKFEIDFIRYENTKSYMKVGNKIFLNVITVKHMQHHLLKKVIFISDAM